MKPQLWGCIAMGVFVAHIGVFMLLSHLRPQIRIKPTEPNFKVRSQTVVDRETGETTVYREITVSTRLADQAPGVPPQLESPGQDSGKSGAPPKDP